MKQPLLWMLFLYFAGCGRWPSTPTPLDLPLQERKETTITCKLTEAPRYMDVPVFDSSMRGKAVTGTYHYKLWLPKGYLADPKQRWPCLFIASAEGNASMGNMAAWLMSNDYVVVMLVESKNGPWEPIIGNFLAAHDDVVQRVRIQEGRKVATGVSGGARASSVFVQIRPGFSGLILQGAGAAYDAGGEHYCLAGIQTNPALNVAMTMGRDDSNRREITEMSAALDASRFLVLDFNGGHTWAPPQVFQQAIEWIEHRIHAERPPAAKAGEPVRETQ
jgi:hypothetical protein